LERRHRRRHQRRRAHRPLWDYVCSGLRAGWSPEQISGRLRREHPRSARMRIAPETVYQWIFRDAMAGGELYKHLRRRRVRRCPSTGCALCRPRPSPSKRRQPSR
jgi:IS30 family transposase